jgi:hypothetical protein
MHFSLGKERLFRFLMTFPPARLLVFTSTISSGEHIRRARIPPANRMLDLFGSDWLDGSRGDDGSGRASIQLSCLNTRQISAARKKAGSFRIDNRCGEI